jgi:type 1 glutamine amidotransferase
MRSCVATCLLAFLSTTALADEPVKPQRVLLLAQSPDGHPASTHEYVAGLKILHHLLARQPGLDVRLVNADAPWTDGPELLDSADAAVLFLSEGAKWVSADEQRLAAFRRLAERQGGLACFHWAMGTKAAEPIANFTALFGGCHGGPDRKYKFLETTLRPTATEHPITSGVQSLTVLEEFYYALKWTDAQPAPQPLMEAVIDDVAYPVAWAWSRPAGGRSFGFSGLHYHANWRRAEYRRLALQGVLWTLGREISREKLPAIDVPEELLPPEDTK